MKTVAPDQQHQRVFLMSPANAGGERARMLLNPSARFDLAVRLQRGTATIGEVFAFVSGLYFRGKVAYVERFGTENGRVPAALVITAGFGLLPPDTLVETEMLRFIAGVPIDLREPRYREPFERDALVLKKEMPTGNVVLLGSIATDKYVRPLLQVFGERLLFPSEFVGRGDMSRGGLMLRSARSGTELTYVPVQDAIRHGPRPPKLPRL